MLSKQKLKPKMEIKDLKNNLTEDKTKILEAQKETVESFKQYFGNYEVIFETINETEKKFNAFFKWRNKEWIVPNKGKTPEQLWKENGNAPVELPYMNIKKNFQKGMDKFGIIADPLYGIVIAPFYGYLKEFFEGDYKKVPSYEEFFEEIVLKGQIIPSFVIKKIILKNQKEAIKLFKKRYKAIVVKDLDDVFKVLGRYREDWSESPQLWRGVIDSEKAGTIQSKANISKEQLEAAKISMKEFELAWQEYFKDKPNPKNDDEERKEQEEFHYWYNNIRKQSDTGKTPVEMEKRIMNFEWDENYSEDYEDNDINENLPPEMTPWETALINKISLFTELSFPDEEEKALKKYEKDCSEEIKVIDSKIDFARGFHAWFLLEYRLPNGKTPMEFIYSREDLPKLFSKREIKMITNFLAFKQSLFEVKKISKNKKDFKLENVIDNKEHFVETIDFPAKLKIGEFIVACIVEKLNKKCFFYGNVACYGKKEGLKIKEEIIKLAEKANKEGKRII